MKWQLIYVTVLYLLLASHMSLAQTDTMAVNDTLAINTMYQEWGKAIATDGAKGYASFFLSDAVLLPPEGPAIEGREAIRLWMQNMMETTSFQPTGFTRDEIRIGNGWAFMRVTIAGIRTLKDGGAPEDVSNKYLDVLQKQTGGSWKFVYRMWNTTK